MLETLLKEEGAGISIRDLALLRVGIDSMLRSGDVLKLTVRDLVHHGNVVSQFAVKQQKTGKVVQCELSEKTRIILAEWLDLNPQFTGEDRVFAITTKQHQRIVKVWCSLLKLDGALYATQSIRKTKTAHLYAKTKNLAAWKVLLGHTNVSATGVYLGVTGEGVNAQELARQFPI